MNSLNQFLNKTETNTSGNFRFSGQSVTKMIV